MTEEIFRNLLEAAARQFASRGYDAVSLSDIADEAGVSVTQLAGAFSTVRDAAAAVLTAEGASMREAQRVASIESDEPLSVLERTFALVGANMANSMVVRAGMRLAAESRQHFPERNTDPYRTWSAFLRHQLEAASRSGSLRPGLDLDVAAWTWVAAGIGAKELISFQDAWDEAEERFAAVAKLLIGIART